MLQERATFLERTVPLLPCPAILPMTEFYTLLGFEVTYQQRAPNGYACVRRGGIDLHFFVLKGLEPAQSYTSCLVIIEDGTAMHGVFAAALRGAYGRVPVQGIPRLGRLRANGAFNVIDPGGNWIRFVQHTEPATSDSSDVDSSDLQRATELAETLSESKGDLVAAAKVLDKALRQVDSAPAAHRLQAVLLRADLALALQDVPKATELLAEIEGLLQQAPAADEHALWAEFLSRAADLAERIEDGEAP
ncbi:hypothetical protein [Deinococcus sp. QL22]|uniref:hypothetical protein n=1 Tax=Deinococcus sp. QL22 TaxID=2939437 RepID=UPI002017E84C|nr:hypothetical protein [Deinococcus sp. QL22]UQN06152.1 hypothetical protein M1R55_15020 [Deinococcus sp. QL22]